MSRKANYDWFPKAGLVAKYKPKILATVTEFCKKYPSVSRDDFLLEAARLATQAEKAFKPESGNKFGTLLIHYLKGLHKLSEREERHRSVEIYEDPEAAAHRGAEEAGEPTQPVDFAGDANGAKVQFDYQWTSAAGRHRVRGGVRLGRYKYTSDGRLLLESKQDMRKRGIPSPDEGDACALMLPGPVDAPVRPAWFRRPIVYRDVPV